MHLASLPTDKSAAQSAAAARDRQPFQQPRARTAAHKKAASNRCPINRCAHIRNPHRGTTMPATGDAVNVKVALRCRPLSKKELSEGDRSIFTKDGNVARLQDPDGRQNGGNPIEFGLSLIHI